MHAYMLLYIYAYIHAVRKCVYNILLCMSLYQTGKRTTVSIGTIDFCLYVLLYFLIFCNEHALLFCFTFICVHMEAVNIVGPGD